MDSKRILNSQQKLNDFSKTQRIKWLVRKQYENKNKLRVQQTEQINEMSAQLVRLRTEFNNTLKSRGLAHRSAITVQSYDNEVIECERRTRSDVMTRAKQVLIKHQTQTVAKQRAMNSEKLKAIETRKQLMKSRVIKDKHIVDDFGNSIIKQLNKLESDEKRLRKLIDDRIKQLNFTENSIEKKAERVSIDSKQLILDTSVITNTNSAVNTEIKQKFDTKHKNDAMIQTDDNTQNDVIAYIEKTGNFAFKLYEKLRSRHIDDNKPKKVFRNIAVNTTTPTKLTDYQTVSDNNADSTISSETSYLALPKQQPNFLIDSSKLSNLNGVDISSSMVSELTKLSDHSNPLHEPNKVNVSLTSNDDDLDPLLDRIQRLRCLIDEKVCDNSGLSVKQSEIISNDSNLSDEANASTSSNSAIFNKLSTIMEAENENTSTDINSSKINSIKRSVSSETPIFSDSRSTKPTNISKSFHVSPPSSLSSNETSFTSLTALSRCSEHEFDTSKPNETLESINFSDISSDIVSNSISGLNSRLHSLPNRNIFWKEVFEMAGVSVAEPDIDNFLKNKQQTDQNFETSVNFSSIRRRHSTPICSSLNRFYGTLDELELTFPDN